MTMKKAVWTFPFSWLKALAIAQDPSLAQALLATP